MRTGFCRSHAVTLPAIKSDVDLQRLTKKRTGPQLIENMMGIEWAVITADACMIAPDDQMRTAKILTNECVQQRLARAGITHFDGIPGLNHRTGPEIIVDHRLDRPSAHLGRNIA